MSALATMEAFEKLLNESLDSSTPKEGEVVNGSVIAIEAGQAIIDIGYKMEGRVDLREFSIPGQPPEISIGDTVEVYLEKVEGSRGEALLSREKARREEAWDRLEKASGKNEKVDGVIFGRVKGGFTVDGKVDKDGNFGRLLRAEPNGTYIPRNFCHILKQHKKASDSKRTKVHFYLKPPAKKNNGDFLKALAESEKELRDLWDDVVAMHYKLEADPTYCPFEFGVRPKQLLESDEADDNGIVKLK